MLAAASPIQFNSIQFCPYVLAVSSSHINKLIMAYNYGPPPGAFSGGGVAPQFPPPGFNAPPGMDPSQFAANMPNINLNAPVIRLGLGGSDPRGLQNDRAGGGRDGPRGRDGGDRRGAGLGYDDRGGNRNIDRERQQVKENMMSMQPPTREEVARTIFVGGLHEGVPGDEQLETLLACAGKLRRWTRARDQNDRDCSFGFAEYEDSDSLDAAAEILQDVEVPLLNKDGTVQREGGEGEGEAAEVKKSKLMVVFDDASIKYIEEWKGKGRENDDQRAFRIESCKEELRNVLARMVNASAHRANGRHSDRDGDTSMGNGEDAVAVLHIPNNMDDELADIPVEQRATVAEEIKAFRDRSHRRDIDRADREQEVEREERARNARGKSPPANTSSSNGIPVGPRGNQGVHGAPSGPKGFRQIPSDYVNGVPFVGQNGGGAYVPLRDDEDAEESDDELERRHQARKKEDLDQQFSDHIRRWQNRERQRGAAQERERMREEDERRNLDKAREDMLMRLANWSEEDERRHIYYKDPSVWSRNRSYILERERREDDDDRRAEALEIEEERSREAEARGQAGDFLSNMNMDIDNRPQQQQQEQPGGGRVKISLGAAKARPPTQPPPAAKRTMLDIEGLLDDEQDTTNSGGDNQLSLKPLSDLSTLPLSGADLTPEELIAAREQLAAEIPRDTESLYAQPIRWEVLTKDLVEKQVRPLVEKKVLELLGIEEAFLVEAVLEGVLGRVGARDMEELVSEALGEEGRGLVRVVWKVLIFWGECVGRGFGTGA